MQIWFLSYLEKGRNTTKLFYFFFKIRKNKDGLLDYESSDNLLAKIVENE